VGISIRVRLTMGIEIKYPVRRICRSEVIGEVNWSFAISSEKQRCLADVIITH